MPNLFKNASWGGISAAIRLIFGMANIFLAIKLAGAISYGYLALILSITAFYVAVINSVHTIAVTHAADMRDKSKSKDSLSILFSAVWMFTLLSVAIICLATYFFGTKFLQTFVYWGSSLDIQSNLNALLIIVLAITSFQIISAGNVAIIESLGRFDLAARAQIFGPVIIFIFLICEYIQYKSLNIAQVGQVLVLGGLLDLILTSFIRLKMGYLSALIPKLHVISLSPKLFSQGLALQGSRVINIFFDPFNKFLLNLYIGPVSVSTYEIAMKIIFGIQGLFGGAFRAFLQLTNKMSSDGAADYLKSLRFGLVPALLLHGIGGVFIVAITHFWLPSEISSLPLFYLLLIPASMVIIFIAPIYFALIGIRDLNFIFKMNFNLAAMNLIGSLILIPIWGIYGAAMGFTIAILYNAFMEYKRYLFMIGEIPMFKQEIRILLNRLITVLLITLTILLIGGFVENKLILIISEVLSGIFLLLILFREPLIKRFYINALTYVSTKYNKFDFSGLTMRFVQKIITNLVLFYRNLPYQPFQSLLRHAYQKYLKSNKKNRTLIKEVNGINFELDLTEVIDAAIFYSDSREPATSKALAALCKPGDIIFDIGANVGSHTLPIAKSVGSSGKVYAFEPVPWALNKLHKNISLNAFNNIIVEPIALSDTPNDNAEFSLRASFKTTSQIPVNADGNLNENWWNACEKVKVRVETIDNFVKENNIKKINLIKLDVDGFEAKVIKGATIVLTEYGPDIIMELAPSWIESKGDNVETIVNSLISIGYVFYNEVTFEKINNMLETLTDLSPGAGINVIISKKKLGFI